MERSEGSARSHSVGWKKEELLEEGRPLRR